MWSTLKLAFHQWSPTQISLRLVLLTVFITVRMREQKARYWGAVGHKLGWDHKSVNGA